MSYCRFSCDDYQSDVYVYADVSGGFTTHVAENKYVFDQPLPPRVDIKDFDAWWARDQKVRSMLDMNQMELIGLPFDGEHFNDATELETVKRLEDLRAIGYNVPQHAIDALREESKGVRP